MLSRLTGYGQPMQSDQLRRREFITLLGGAAATWPLTAPAQQPMMPVIGYISSRSPQAEQSELSAFRQGLNETGYVEGRNAAIEYRFASGRLDRLPALAADLMRRRVAVIAAAGNVAARASKESTAEIPIVFHTADDPIAIGLVTSLSRPGGNVTGVTAMAGALPTKRLELLHELLPMATTVGLLVNPANANAEPDSGALQAAAGALGLQAYVLNAASDDDIETVFANLSRKQITALVVNSDAFLTSRRKVIVGLAARYKIPAIYSFREHAADGGLISYGTFRSEGYRQMGVYVGRILKGAKTTDLPVIQPTRFELVINLKTAKALGIDIPPTLLAIADEVIE
jgi:putative ABC transport system substrate-binding protein